MASDAELQDVPLRSPESEDGPEIVTHSSTADEKQKSTAAATTPSNPSANESHTDTGSGDAPQQQKRLLVSTERSAAVKEIMILEGAVKQLARLEISLSQGSVTDRDLVDALLDIVSTVKVYRAFIFLRAIAVMCFFAFIVPVP